MHHEHKRLPHQNKNTLKITIHSKYSPTTQKKLYVNTLKHYMYSQNIINTTTMDFLLLPRKTRTSLLYELLKINKPNCSINPIVPGCDSPTDRLSSYVTHFIQPLANNLPSHIKGTKHFLHLIEKLPLLPTIVVLVTVDGTSLYTDIPHDDGISAVIHFMKKYKHLLPTNCPLPHIIYAIFHFIFKYSAFNFMDTHINQFLSTFIGINMIPYMRIFSWAKRNVPPS